MWCVCEICSVVYLFEVIVLWVVLFLLVYYCVLIGQGGCIVVEDVEGYLFGYGVIDQVGNEIDVLFVDFDQGGWGIGWVLMDVMVVLGDLLCLLVLLVLFNVVLFYWCVGFQLLCEEVYVYFSGVLFVLVCMQCGQGWLVLFQVVDYVVAGVQFVGVVGGQQVVVGGGFLVQYFVGVEGVGQIVQY